MSGSFANPPGSGSIQQFEAVSALVGGLAQIAVEAWRLSRLAPQLCDADRRRVQAIADRLGARLSQAGVAIDEHSGETFVDGMALEVVATEPEGELLEAGATVLETLKPSVYVAGQLIVQGQVILGRGTRKNAGTEGATDGPSDD